MNLFLFLSIFLNCSASPRNQRLRVIVVVVATFEFAPGSFDLRGRQRPVLILIEQVPGWRRRLAVGGLHAAKDR